MNGEQVDLENNPDKDLCRYEFFEILVRIANEIYKDKKVSEGLVLLLEEHLAPNRPK